MNVRVRSGLPIMANQLGLFEGRRRKEKGMTLVDFAESAAWKKAADDVIAALAQSHEPFTADDVRLWAGDPVHMNAMGARLNAAAHAGLIQKIGYQPSKRPQGHARIMAVWRGSRLEVS